LVFMGKTYLRTNINLNSMEVYGDDTALREERVRKCCTWFENSLKVVIAPVGPWYRGRILTQYKSKNP